MKISVNGEVREVEAPLDVGAVVRTVGARATIGVAVALNGEVVPKSEWGTTTLEEGDKVEILNAIGGG